MPAQEIEKFEKNLKESNHIKVGKKFSSWRAKHRKFEITYDDKQYFIYVPNAHQDENLIVWSVFLANELAALDGELTDGQTQEILKLQRKFHENMDKTPWFYKLMSIYKLRSLKEVVDNLEANLVTFLDVIQLI